MPCLATVVWYVICLYYSNMKDFWKFSDQRFKEKLRIQTQLLKYSYVESVNDAWTIQWNYNSFVDYSLLIIFLSSHRIITEFPLNGYGAVRTSRYRKVNDFDDPTPGSHTEHQEPPTPNSKPPNHHPRRTDYPTQQKHARFFCRVRVHISFLLGSEKP